ncbi:magnesium/cobalt transporter CorA [Oleiagrimonas sp. C23AA]|uniref:magnesium/cobalt transporter CorA n=1 Tax=Oleiagrimonas sp. C23AA TaxID=2719047 RepID=UPI00141EEAEB|nr:magnesium/cobalt transporter CorA [Oleiagrimonas sp. C23AA]NII11455.1 magnesium/cobalt transporter CorA [Oleiagrimonas sp. C23AA]
MKRMQLSQSPARSAASSDAPMVVNCVAYSREGRRIGDIGLDQISDVMRDSDAFIWVGLHEPDEALLEKLQEEFDLHDLAIEDAQYAHQRTKIEAYGDSLFIVAQTAQLVGGSIAFGETHIFLGSRYLITVRHGASLSYAPARRTCEAAPELLTLGPSFGLYAILDFIVDNFLPIVSDFREELQELEQDIFRETYKRDTIKRLYDMQRELMTLRLAVAPLQDITNQLVRLHPHLIRDETRVYFRDVYDHVIRVNEATSTMREMLGAAINVNLSLVTFGQNEVMKKLAGWAAMLAAPTLITSWYGMNFHHMPELDKGWAYPSMIVITVSLVGGIYIALKRARWL